MKRERTSLAEVLVYEAFRVNKAFWLTNADLEEILEEVQPRTIRAHTRELARIKLIEQTPLYPAHRFKWSDEGAESNQEYVDTLEKAKRALEIRSENSFRVQRKANVPRE